MDLTQLLLGEKHLEAIGWTLAHSVWQIALAGLLLWIVLRIIPRKAANIRYLAGLFTLAAIFLTSCWTFTHQLQAGETIETSTSMSTVHHAASPRAEPFPSTTEPRVKGQGLALFISNQLEHYLPFLTNIWLLGALFYFSRMMGGLYDLQKLDKDHRESVSNNLLKKVNGLSASLGIFKRIRVLKSSYIQSPITYGIFKPVVLLPAALVLSMEPRQLEAIIAHELAHIKRHDYLANLFQSVLEILFFYHPCFWWINETIHAEREYATDDLVLSLGIDARDLAYGLTTVVTHSSQTTPEMALAASSGGHQTLDRIKRVLGRPTTTPRFSPLLTLTMITTLIVGTVLMVAAQDSENDKGELLLTQIGPATEDFIIAPVPFSSPDDLASIDTIPSHQQGEENDEMPILHLSPVPTLDFEVLPVPPIPPVIIPPLPQVSFGNPELQPQLDSLERITKDLSRLSDDPSETAKSKRNELQAALAHVKKNIQDLTQKYRENLSEWEGLSSENMQKYQEDMKAWQEEYQKNWENDMAPQIQAFQEKMKAWQEENAPRIKEFEERMKAWQETHKDKFNWAP